MRRAALLLVLTASCATLADGHAGLDNPPSANAGPFRLLESGEIGHGSPAPYAVDDGKAFYRDPSVMLAVGGTSFEVWGYFSASDTAEGPSTRITRLTAADGRSFDHNSPSDVLVPDLEWEAGTVGAPSAVRDGGAVRLAYAAGGGIGTAISLEGTSFAKEASPAVGPGFAAWFDGTPRSPGIVFLPDGAHLFYEADGPRGVSIGEARETAEGWVPVGDGPALAPDSDLDAGGALSPSPVLATSEEGRDILYVYYTTVAADGTHRLGMAARFLSDPDSRLEKSSSTMLAPSPKLEAREPSVVRFEDFSLLFATANASKTSRDPAVLVSIAPALAPFPPANPP